jgi:hypothetical protein
MRSFARIAALFAAAAASFCAVQVSVAEEVGEFRFLASLESAYTTIEHAGASITGGSSSGTFSVVESTGGPFVAGAHHLATCVVLVRESGGEVELEAPCTLTGASGDRLYVVSVRDSGDIAAGGPGRIEILGGSGAWAGIQGTCSYDATYLGRHVVSVAECEWRRP